MTTPDALRAIEETRYCLDLTDNGRYYVKDSSSGAVVCSVGGVESGHALLAHLNALLTLARDLARELSEETRVKNAAREALGITMAERDEARARLASVTAERERLRDALKMEWPTVEEVRAEIERSMTASFGEGWSLARAKVAAAIDVLDFIRKRALSPAAEGATSTPKDRCPKCRGEVVTVTNDGRGMLNDEQFDSVKAGDVYCEKCPPNDRANKNVRCYWWRSELVAPAPTGREETR